MDTIMMCIFSAYTFAGYNYTTVPCYNPSTQTTQPCTEVYMELVEKPADALPHSKMSTTYMFIKEGKYVFELVEREIATGDLLEIKDTFVFLIGNKPDVYPDEITICSGDTVTLLPNTELFPGNEYDFTPERPVNYLLITKNSFCSATEALKVNTVNCNTILPVKKKKEEKPEEIKQQCFIPNVFSPNNDGVNDLFEAYTNGKIVTFKIFNRWGDILCDKMPWNPQLNCDEGVYVAYVVVDYNGITETYYQDVKLIR